ncbi:hypothetical protein CMO96_02040 [Candidatus Woesebacteria bacterium]|nr:hypothetical protein [Candidatus Woesebacteria bacterium]
MPNCGDKTWRLEFFKDLQKRFFALERTVSIVIQGPLHKRSIDTIPEYLKYGDVIVSCWEDDDMSLLYGYKDRIKVVINKYSEVPRSRLRSFGRHGPSPWIYQNYSTYHGIKEATGFFVIKVRSDESYPDLNAFIEKLFYWNELPDSPTKIITSDIYFRFDKEEPFHPSDHIIAGKRRNLKDGFRRAVFNCRAEINKKYAFPERLICASILEILWDFDNKTYLKPDPNKSKEIMQKYFDIVSISKLKNFTWSSSYRKYEGLKQREGGWCANINLL